MVISAKVIQDIYFVVVAAFVAEPVISAASCCVYTTSGNHSINCSRIVAASTLPRTRETPADRAPMPGFGRRRAVIADT
ncbi:hypothetical protein, partial [Nocardia lasii]